MTCKGMVLVLQGSYWFVDHISAYGALSAVLEACVDSSERSSACRKPGSAPGASLNNEIAVCLAGQGVQCAAAASTGAGQAVKQTATPTTARHDDDKD